MNRSVTLLWPAMVVLMVLGAMNAAAGAAGESEGAAGTAERVELTFTYWGSPFERAAVKQMLEAFNQAHPDIQVRGQHIPDGYTEKIATMVAGGTAPDVGYINKQQAFLWAQ